MVSQWTERIDHFTVLCHINKAFHSIFGLTNYFTFGNKPDCKLNPIQKAQFESDAALFEKHVWPYFGRKQHNQYGYQTILTFDGSAAVPPLLARYLVMFLSFYPRFVALQCRFNRELSRHSIRGYASFTEKTSSEMTAFPNQIRKVSITNLDIHQNKSFVCFQFGEKQTDGFC